nr:hypothetical protein CFP56_06545 [Quercus suber]
MAETWLVGRLKLWNKTVLDSVSVSDMVGGKSDGMENFVVGPLKTCEDEEGMGGKSDAMEMESDECSNCWTTRTKLRETQIRFCKHSHHKGHRGLTLSFGRLCDRHKGACTGLERKNNPWLY